MLTVTFLLTISALYPVIVEPYAPEAPFQVTLISDNISTNVSPVIKEAVDDVKSVSVALVNVGLTLLGTLALNGIDLVPMLVLPE